MILKMMIMFILYNVNIYKIKYKGDKYEYLYIINKVMSRV